MSDLQSDSSTLFEEVRSLVLASRVSASSQINLLHVTTAFEIGRSIVEFEQKGVSRAEYGSELLKTLSLRLISEFGRGFSRTNLEYMRRFYLAYNVQRRISQTASGIFKLAWSQYVFLMAITDLQERRFYEIEAADNGWTLPELKRQHSSGLYERLSLSRNKEAIEELSIQGQIIRSPQDMIKDPLVLEFLGLEERDAYSETDLESAIITKLERFLLELGKGFLFEARQKRLTFGADHFYVDLVFYNRLLRCYVLVDLKIGKLTHQDLGQMQMYVNFFDRNLRLEDENPTVGIVLCKMKNDALVELTLPKDANIYASRYLLYLPSKDDLKRQILDVNSGEYE